MSLTPGDKPHTYPKYELTLCSIPIGGDLHMKDKNVQITRRPSPLLGHCVTQGITTLTASDFASE